MNDVDICRNVHNISLYIQSKYILIRHPIRKQVNWVIHIVLFWSVLFTDKKSVTEIRYVKRSLPHNDVVRQFDDVITIMAECTMGYPHDHQAQGF